jgi:hypothetical protein
MDRAVESIAHGALLSLLEATTEHLQWKEGEWFPLVKDKYATSLQTIINRFNIQLERHIAK